MSSQLETKREPDGQAADQGLDQMRDSTDRMIWENGYLKAQCDALDALTAGGNKALLDWARSAPPERPVQDRG